MVKNLLLIISLLVTLIAIFGDTKRPGQSFPNNVTMAGWALVLLAITTAFLSLRISAENDRADRLREFVALRQLEQAIHKIITPYLINSDPPEAEDRFRVVERYIPVMSGICDVELEAPVGRTFYDRGMEDVPWAEYLSIKTREGLADLARVQAADGSVLDGRINQLIGVVELHPWNDLVRAAPGWQRKPANRLLKKSIFGR